MDNTQVEKNRVIVAGKTIEFDYEIRKIERVGDVYVILLGIPFESEFLHNVYGIASSGEVVWRVQDAAEIFPVKKQLPYEQFYVNEQEQVIVSNFYGVSYAVDAETGKIVERGATK